MAHPFGWCEKCVYQSVFCLLAQSLGYLLGYEAKCCCWQLYQDSSHSTSINHVSMGKARNTAKKIASCLGNLTTIQDKDEKRQEVRTWRPRSVGCCGLCWGVPLWHSDFHLKYKIPGDMFRKLAYPCQETTPGCDLSGKPHSPCSLLHNCTT